MGHNRSRGLQAELRHDGRRAKALRYALADLSHPILLDRALACPSKVDRRCVFAREVDRPLAVQWLVTSNRPTVRTRRLSLSEGLGRLRAPADAVPPTGLVMLAVFSVQLGSGVAKHLFQAVGPGGAAFLRVGFAAVILLLWSRPRLQGHARVHYALAALFGLSVVAMNASFYLALDRIPLGIAVTLEFVGPLGVAVAGSRRPVDGLWVLLAAAGVLLLAPGTGMRLDPLGVLFALLAGCFWAAYIILSARVGRTFSGGDGLAIAMAVGAVALLPVGVLSAGRTLLDPVPLLGGASIALLSSVIPYSLELDALRRLPTRVFGVLMSTEPAAAALIGFAVLREVISLRALIAIVLVTTAAAGSSRFSSNPPVD